MEVMKRPSDANLCFLMNDVVYASNTLLNGIWTGGLFSKVDIEKERVLCEYTGRILTKDEEMTSSSEYLMSVRDPLDLRRRRVIDGDPARYSNIAAYANHSDNKHANAFFVDKTRKNGVCKVLLIANEFIPEGTEIRVDYDMGSSVHPFRDMMINKGIYDHSTQYRRLKWEFPSVN